MSDPFIERIENLIRVVSSVPDNRFNLRRWFNPITRCGCAVGHAMRDSWFIGEGFRPNLAHNTMVDIARFFGITEARAFSLFVNHVEYNTRQDVITALRVLLLEKMAHRIGDDIEMAAELEMAD